MSKKTANTEAYPRAGFFRRVAAMIYDALIAVAIGMLAGLVINTALVVLIANDVLPAFGAEQPSDSIANAWQYTWAIRIWISLWVIAFFLWFWHKGGQTLGMRAWRLRLFSIDEKPVAFKQLLVRLATSLLGLGTLVVLFDVRSKLALQDRCSGIDMRVLTKSANDHKNW